VFLLAKLVIFGVGSVWSPNNLVNLYPLVADNPRHFYYLAKTDLSTEPYDRRQTYFLVLLPRPSLTYLSIRFGKRRRRTSCVKIINNLGFKHTYGNLVCSLWISVKYRTPN